MRKVATKILSIILNILLTLVILMLILVMYNYFQTHVLKKDYTNFFGYTVFQVATGSMAQTINVGDIVIVQIKKENTDFEKDDIIVFKQNNYIITHRIVDINEGKIITKGDANNTIDEPITKENIIGKVVKIIPNIEIWKKVLTYPDVLISGVTTIILFGIAFSYNGNKKVSNKVNFKDEKEDKK